MSILTPMLNMDDNLGLGTPNFFSSAWDPEQTNFPFAEGFRSGVEDYGSYAPQLHQGQAESNHLDYFSNQLDDRFSNHATYQSGYQFGNTHSNDDLDRILGAPETSLLGKGVTTTQPNTIFNPLFHTTQMHAVQNSGAPAIFHSSTSQTGDWKLKADAHPAPAKLV